MEVDPKWVALEANTLYNSTTLLWKIIISFLHLLNKNYSDTKRFIFVTLPVRDLLYNIHLAKEIQFIAFLFTTLLTLLCI